MDIYVYICVYTNAYMYIFMYIYAPSLLSNISYTQHLPLTYTPSHVDANWDGAGAVDKYKDNKWVTLKAMVRYATTVKLRSAVVRWSRVSLASLFCRRRFILLKCYPTWKALAHQQR